MKNLLIIASAILILMSVAAKAQKRGTTPETKAKIQSETLAKDLGLSEEVEQQVYEICLEAFKKMDELKQSSSTRDTKKEIRDDMMAEFKEILTEEQYEKAKEAMNSSRNKKR